MTDELDKFKLWVVEILFTEEDLQEFESRGIDPIYEDSQVFVVGTVEFEASESRKDMACRRRWKSESPFRVGSPRRDCIFEPKYFEAGQRGEASGHHLGRNEPKIGNLMTMNAKGNEMSSR